MQNSFTQPEKAQGVTNRCIATAVLMLCIAFLPACALVEATGQLAQSVVQTGTNAAALFTGADNKDYSRVLAEGTAADIQKALDEGMNVNSSTREDGFTALMLVACKNPHVDQGRSALKRKSLCAVLAFWRYLA